MVVAALKPTKSATRCFSLSSFLFRCACMNPTSTPARSASRTPVAPEALHYAFFRSIEAAGRDWDAAAPPHRGVVMSGETTEALRALGYVE